MPKENVKYSNTNAARQKLSGQHVLQSALLFLILFSPLLSIVILVHPKLKIVFGGWNSFAFNLCAGMGYTALMMLYVFSRRVVHRAELQSNLRILDLTFFNAFWVPVAFSRNLKLFRSTFQNFNIQYDLTLATQGLR
jgi:hypothetical protein